MSDERSVEEIATHISRWCTEAPDEIRTEITEALFTERQRAEEAQEEVYFLKNTIDDLYPRFYDAQATIARLERALNKSTDKNTLLAEELAGAEATIAKLEANWKEAEGQRQSAERREKMAIENCEKLQSQVAKLREGLKEIYPMVDTVEALRIKQLLTEVDE